MSTPDSPTSSGTAESAASAAPSVSVVIPVHNRASCVGTAIESALSQDVEDVEVVCVDDASTDSSAEVLVAYAARDPRVRVVTLEKNGGTGVARKTGILAARGEFILCLDADDRFLPGVFRRLLAVMRRKGVDVLQYRCKVVPTGTARKSFVRYFQRLLDFHLPARRAGSWRLLRDQAKSVRKTHWVVWNKIYRAAPLQAAARLQEDGWMVAGEDMLLTVILQSFLPSWGATRLRCLEYRCGEGSIRDTEMTPEVFDWKLNRADCCRALKRYVDAESERLVPGFGGEDRDAVYAAATRRTRRRLTGINGLCRNLVADRMEITWRQIPADAPEDVLSIYHRKFYVAWGSGLCHEFFSRGVSLLHVQESLTFRLGAWLLSPLVIPLVHLRRLRGRTEKTASRASGEGKAHA